MEYCTLVVVQMNADKAWGQRDSTVGTSWKESGQQTGTTWPETRLVIRP